MADIYHLDYESTSLCDIKLGAYRYAADPSTRILMFAIAKNDNPPVAWNFIDGNKGEGMIALHDLRRAVETGGRIFSHNVGFEIPMSHYRLVADTGVEPPPLEVWRCTKAMALRAAIPASLAGASEFLKLSDKDKRGKALIGVFSDQRHLTTLSNGKERMKVPSPILCNPIPWNWTVTVAGEHITVRKAWEMFIDYCRQDVVVEQQIHKKLAKFELTGTELEGFLFDLRMNHRGIPVNVPALRHAKTIVDDHAAALTEEFNALTGLMPSQNKKVKEWLQARGYKGDSLDLESREKYAADLEDPDAKMALHLAGQLSFAAVKKVDAMLDTACPDDRMRGLFTWHGAQRTGRWTSSGPQMQNAKKPSIKQPDEAYKYLCQGACLDTLRQFYGNPYEVIASVIRNFVKPHNGMMLDADYSNIESRVAAWLVGCDEELEMYRTGRDVYKDLASSIFGTPYEEVSKDQRFVGKVGMLSCIAEGELVLTDSGLIPIEKVLPCHRVWDGVEWVCHEGSIFQGYREVIDYDGLRATPDHEVFTIEEGQLRKDCFGECQQSQKTIVRSELDGSAIRVLDSVEHRSNSEREERRELHSSPMRLRSGVSSLLFEHGDGKKPSMLQMQRTKKSKTLSEVVSAKDDGAAEQVSKSKGSEFQELRSERSRIPVCINRRSMYVGDGESRTPSTLNAGSYRQQWTLRERESQVCQSARANAKHSGFGAQRDVRPESMALLLECSSQEDGSWSDSDADFRGCTDRSGGEEKELARNPCKVRVYDLLNAGPRNRFTVSGKLVSNCCFQTGAQKLHETCANWGQPISKEVAIRTVKSFRESKPGYPVAWKSYGSAISKAIKAPGEWFDASPYVKFGRTLKEPFDRLIMRLPSGRDIIYPYPQIQRKVTRNRDFETGEWREWETDEITFYGQGKVGVNWMRVATYPASCFQSSVQGTARDFMLYGCLQAEKAGFDIFALIHDQALAEDGDSDAFVKALCTLPPWVPNDFPLAAAGGRVPYYAKD